MSDTMTTDEKRKAHWSTLPEFQAPAGFWDRVASDSAFWNYMLRERPVESESHESLSAVQDGGGTGESGRELPNTRNGGRVLDYSAGQERCW